MTENIDPDLDFPTQAPAPAGVPLVEGLEDVTYVTIRSSAGDPRYVAVTEAEPFSAILARSGLTSSGALDIYVDGAQILASDMVQPGSTVTILGNVKGG